MYNVFLAQTPFQLFNAVEAKNRFHLNQKNILIIINIKVHKINLKSISLSNSGAYLLTAIINDLYKEK